VDGRFVGSQVRGVAAPFRPPSNSRHGSPEATFTYRVTDRLRVTLTVLFSRDTHDRFYAEAAYA